MDRIEVSPEEQRTITALLSLPPLILSPGKLSPAFTEEEARQLASIKTFSEEYLFNPLDSDKFYQLVSMVIMIKNGKAVMVKQPTGAEIVEEDDEKGVGFAKTLQYLLSAKWIFPEETVHQSPLLNNVREVIELRLRNEEQEPIVEEGNIVCVNPKCDSRRIKRNFAQTRGGDEAFTGFFLCTECGKQWKKS